MNEIYDMPPTIHAVPVLLNLPTGARFIRLGVAPGIVIRRFDGPLVKQIAVASKTLPLPQPIATPTHVILLDEEAYQANLTKQLRAEEKTQEERAHRFFIVDGMVRQTLISLTLLVGASWTIYGDYRFTKPTNRSTSPTYTGYANRPTTGVSMLMRLMLGDRMRRKFTPTQVRALAASLDRYYRADFWWMDPVSTALGYVWGALTATDSALAFAACSMALESLVATPQQEISHSLAERCALLTSRRGVDKLKRYGEVKRLYNLRSKIVHGKSSPKRGTITQGSLIVSAKYSNIPIDDLRLMLNITLDTVLAALGSPGYRQVVHTKQSDEATTKALNQYFLDALLGASRWA